MYSPSKGELEGDYGLLHQTNAAKTTTECTNGNSLEQMLYNYLVQEQSDSLLALLHCVNTEWAIKILVGTYVDEKQYTLALTELQKLDTTKTENTEFVTIYTAIINELQGNTTGRTIPTKTILEKMAATQRRSQPNVLAETALASYFGYDYTRSFETAKTETLPNTTTKSFSLIPNPAQDVVTIVFATEVASNTTFTIYDINGKATTSVAVSKDTQQLNLNISHLPSGIYYCRLANSAGIEKLVIIVK